MTAASDLGRRARQGAVVTLGSQGVRLLVQVVGLAVLGRLLEPHDYGLVAIVTVLVAAGEVFRDFGLSAAAIQAETLSRAQRDNLFWINTGIGVTLAATLCALSPVLARVYDDERLVPLALVMSSVFVINGVSTQYRAGLARGLSFGRLSTAELTGQVCGVAAAVAVAVLGGGYWALAVQWVFAQSVALVMVAAWSRWLPGRVDRTATVRPFLRFGSALLGSTLLNNSVTYAAPLALGLTASPAAVGIYNRAQQLVTMPLVQVQAPTTRVALPVLSRLQGEPERFSAMLLKGQLMLLTLIGLAFAVLFAQAPSAVRVVLGPQWGATVPLFRLLLVAGFFQAATYAASWVFQSRGLTGSQLRYSLATRPAFVLAVVVGSMWGPAGTAVAYTLSLAVAWPVSLLWLSRVGGVPTGRMFANGLRTGILASTAAVASWAVTHAVDVPAVLDLVLGGATALLVGAAAFAVVPSYRREAPVLAAAVKKVTSRLPRSRVAAVERRWAALQRATTRAWYGSGVPTALDRAAVGAAVRRARRQGASTAGGPLHLVLAAPGEGNIGDQALLEALLERDADAEDAYGFGAPPPSRPAPLGPGVSLLHPPHLLYGSGERHRASVRAFGAALARSTHLSVVGADVMDGGYSLPASVRRASFAAAAARAGLDARVIGFSWKASPRPAAVRELRRAGRSGVRLLARDPLSADRLERDGVRGVTRVADVVFTARSVDTSAADRLLDRVTAPVALVNASGLIARGPDLADDYAVLVRALRSRGLHVVLLPHVLRAGTDDLAACRRVAERLAPGEAQLVEELLTPAQVRGLAHRAAVTVTGRMHLSVMSMMAGVPAVTLATQGKVEGLVQLFGVPELAVEPAHGFSALVVPLVDAALPEGSPLRASVRGALPRVEALAELNLVGLSPVDDLVPTGAGAPGRCADTTASPGDDR